MDRISDRRPVRWLVALGDWRGWMDGYAFLPVIVACDGETLPEQWTAVWASQATSVLLETGKQGRYTILGADIRTRLEGGPERARVCVPGRDGAGETGLEHIVGQPLAVLRAWLAQRSAPPVVGAPPFYGGLAGYLTYDAGENMETLRLPDRPELDYPWYIWAEILEGWVFDHETGTVYCFKLCRTADIGREPGAVEAAFARSQARVLELREQWTCWRTAVVPPPPAEQPVELPVDFFQKQRSFVAASASEWIRDRMPAPSRSPLPSIRRVLPSRIESHSACLAPGVRLSLGREAFIAAVGVVQERIGAGETYQVNLSVRQSRPLPAAPERIYEALRRLNPSPYMALLRFPAVTVVSGSPELLLSVADGRVETHPIAATRPRGATPEADEALAAELVASAKECAEHLMMVDLLRNDIGRVADFGTVRVTDFMAVERYSHVMHLVSRIEGRLAAGRTACDAIAALFPGGTITGAPKIRTMEIIGELEPERRGVYTGAIGWLGYNGNLKLNIAIRTLVAVGGEAQVQSGAGIVADSNPEHEFEESLNKARALWLAVERAAAEGGGHV
jgi:para-aminobenzoate synthetase component 1